MSKGNSFASSKKVIGELVETLDGTAMYKLAEHQYQMLHRLPALLTTCTNFNPTTEMDRSEAKNMFPAIQSRIIKGS